MKQSTFPLELLLGMKYYASDAAGIGGKLRAFPSDFIVDEIPLTGERRFRRPLSHLHADKDQLGTPARDKGNRKTPWHQSPPYRVGRHKGPQCHNPPEDLAL